MTDTFTSNFEFHLRQTRADRIASERVTALRPDLDAPQRASFALQTISSALSILEMVADEAHLNAQQIEEMDSAESRLAMLRMRAKMRRSLIHLTSSMGKAP
jgi:hypothetical protein